MSLALGEAGAAERRFREALELAGGIGYEAGARGAREGLQRQGRR